MSDRIKAIETLIRDLKKEEQKELFENYIYGRFVFSKTAQKQDYWVKMIENFNKAIDEDDWRKWN